MVSACVHGFASAMKSLMALYTCLVGFDFSDHSEDKRNPQPENSAKRIQENIFNIRRKRTIHGENQRNAKIWNGACDGSIDRKIQ